MYVTAAQPAPRLMDQAYEYLHEQIVWLQLPPGAPLSEKLLAAEIGVGATPIRDAIKRLTFEHLVVVFRQRGTFVAEVNVTDERWLTEVRLDTESLAAGLAAVRATDEQRADIVTKLEARHHATSQRELTEFDAQIHRAIFTACRNQFLQDTLNQYFSLALRMWNFCQYQLKDVELGESSTDLDMLVDAIVHKDPAGAQAAARAHVQHSANELRNLLQL